MMSRDAINYQNSLTDDQLLAISLDRVRRAAETSKDRSWSWSTRWHGFAMPSAANARYHDYDVPLSSRADRRAIDQWFGALHVFERDNYLIVEIDPAYQDEIAAEARETADRHGWMAAEFETFESIRCNGMDYFTIDQIGAMSEAPAFGDLAYLPDWIADVKKQAALWRVEGKHYLLPDDWYYETDWSRSTVWTAIDYYQVRSPLMDLIEKGRATFRRAD